MTEKKELNFKNRLIGQAFVSWNEVRLQTLTLLDHLPEELLGVKFPRPVYSSFGKQFQELGVIQNAFIKAIRTGTVDYSDMDVDFDSDLIASKTNIRQFLEEKDEKLQEVLKEEDNPSRIIDWGLPRNPTLLEHVYWLSQHETLHQGQFIAYCYLLNIEFPESWSMSMALPPREPDLVFEWLRNWKKYVHQT